MLILLWKTIFIPVCTSLVTIKFSASAQLVSSSLLSYHGCGGLRKRRRKEEALGEREQDKQARPPDLNTTFIFQEVVRTAKFKWKTAGSTMATRQAVREGHQQ